MRTAHEDCQGETGCIHADAVMGNLEQLMEELREATMSAMEDGLDPMFSSYFKGFHEGYRLAQLQLQPIDKSKAN